MQLYKEGTYSISKIRTANWRVTLTTCAFHPHQIRSNPIDLVGLHDGIRPGNLIPAWFLIVEGAVVPVGVAMHRAESLPAAAIEAGKSNALPAEIAAVCGLLNRIFGWGARLRIFFDLLLLLCCRRNGSRGPRLLENEVAVALGAEIVRRGASEESAVIRAEDRPVWGSAAAFFRFSLLPFLLHHETRVGEKKKTQESVLFEGFDYGWNFKKIGCKNANYRWNQEKKRAWIVFI